jgi:hypothetical protein
VGRASFYGNSIDEAIPAIAELSIRLNTKEHRGLEIVSRRRAVIID